MCIVVFALFRWILMHSIRGIEQFGTTIYTKFVAIGILQRPTIPAPLIALTVGNQVNMFVRCITYDLCDLVAFYNQLSNGPSRETRARFWSIGSWLSFW